MSFQPKFTRNLPIISSYVVLIIATSICTIFGITAEIATVPRTSSHFALGLGVVVMIFSSFGLRWTYRDQLLTANRRKKPIIQTCLGISVVASLVGNAYILIDLKAELSRDVKDVTYISVHAALGAMLAIIACFSCIILLYLSINHEDYQGTQQNIKKTVNNQVSLNYHSSSSSDLALSRYNYQTPDKSCMLQFIKYKCANVTQGTIV